MPRRKAYGTRVSFDLPEDVRRELRAKCIMDGFTLTEKMQRLVFEYIDGDYNKYYGEDVEWLTRIL